MQAFLRWALAAALTSLATAATAMKASDAGTFVALDEEGNPVEKILRVTRQSAGWTFEDRQPDGSWLDVSCHGGCDHRPVTGEELVEMFGSAPPPGLTPECIANAEYAFCHFVKEAPDERRDGYVLVVRAGTRWHPISLLRLPEGEGNRDPPRGAPLESAGI